MGKPSAGRSGSLSEDQPPWAAPQAPEIVRSPMRRAVLGVIVLGVVAAIAVCLFVLDGVAARLAPGAGEGGSSTAELADCAELYPEWTEEWLQTQLRGIRDEKGDDANGVAVPWRTPETFPAAALAWADVAPECGSTMIVDIDGSAWSYRLEVVEATGTQFDAVASVLVAMGYSLTFDQVPHDLLQVGEVAPEAEVTESEDGQSGGEVDQGGASATTWYREFANPDGWIWMTFFPDDPDAEEPLGELVIGYETAD
jgi:hypothetical protein